MRQRPKQEVDLVVWMTATLEVVLVDVVGAEARGEALTAQGSFAQTARAVRAAVGIAVARVAAWPAATEDAATVAGAGLEERVA